MIGDDEHILLGLYSGKIEVWTNAANLDELKKLHTIKSAHLGSVFCLSLNDNYAVSGSFDRCICVFDRSEGYKLVGKIDGCHKEMIYGIVINDNNFILAGSHDSMLSLWKMNQNRELHHLKDMKGHTGSIKSIDCAPNNSAVTASSDGTIKVWCLKTKSNTSTIDLAGSPSCVKVVWPQVFVACKSQNVSDEQNCFLVRIYDLMKGVCVRNLYGHSARITSLDVHGSLVVSGDINGNILIFSKYGNEETPRTVVNPINANCCKVYLFLDQISKNCSRGIHVAWQRGEIAYLDYFTHL